MDRRRGAIAHLDARNFEAMRRSRVFWHMRVVGQKKSGSKCHNCRAQRAGLDRKFRGERKFGRSRALMAGGIMAQMRANLME